MLSKGSQRQKYNTLPGFPTGFFTGLMRLYTFKKAYFRATSSLQSDHFMYYTGSIYKATINLHTEREANQELHLQRRLNT